MRLFRLIPLLLLVAIAGGAWWGWRRLHRSDAPSLSAARASVGTVKAAGVPQGGVYRYSAGGSERIGIGPLTVQRDLPSEAFLVVRPLSAAIRVIEWQLSGDHTESWQTATGITGVRGTARKLSVGTFGARHTVSGAVQPAALLYPRHIKAGLAWDSTYRVSGIVFHRTSKVQGQATLTVGGVPVKVFQILTQETVTGALHGKDSFTEWYAPSAGVPVKLAWHRNLDGSIVNVLTETLTLQSIVPASPG